MNTVEEWKAWLKLTKDPEPGWGIRTLYWHTELRRIREPGSSLSFRRTMTPRLIRRMSAQERTEYNEGRSLPKGTKVFSYTGRDSRVAGAMVYCPVPREPRFLPEPQSDPGFWSLSTALPVTTPTTMEERVAELEATAENHGTRISVLEGVAAGNWPIVPLAPEDPNGPAPLGTLPA
jgi:hypothetical protein